MERPYKDTRHHKRFIVDVMDITGGVIVSNEVIIRDISIAGLSLETHSKLLPGRKHTVTISHKNRNISLECMVIWSLENEIRKRPDEGSPLRYASGLQFANLQQNALADLMKFIESHLFKKDARAQIRTRGHRTNVRFRLNQRERATINVIEPFTVKTLSLGGMLIESDHFYELESSLRMEVTLPVNVILSFTGNVTSCLPAKDKPTGHYELGIKFITLSEHDKAKLKDLVRRLYLKDAGFIL
jgi:hypothetical protein